MKNLEENRNRIEKSMDYPELGIVINLAAVIKLLSERKYIAARWEGLIKSCPTIESAIKYPREPSSLSLITAISNCYSTLLRTSQNPLLIGFSS